MCAESKCVLFCFARGFETGSRLAMWRIWEDLKLRWGRHCTSLLSQTGSEAGDVRDFSGGRY